MTHQCVTYQSRFDPYPWVGSTGRSVWWRYFPPKFTWILSCNLLKEVTAQNSSKFRGKIPSSYRPTSWPHSWIGVEPWLVCDALMSHYPFFMFWNIIRRVMLFFSMHLSSYNYREKYPRTASRKFQNQFIGIPRS